MTMSSTYDFYDEDGKLRYDDGCKDYAAQQPGCAACATAAWFDTISFIRYICM